MQPGQFLGEQGHALAPREASQRIVDLPIDLDPLAHETGACRVALLSRNADLRGSRLLWSGARHQLRAACRTRTWHVIQSG
jgi:hypothetical protein